MINNIVLIALLISITLPINANALTKIEQQEARLNHLNNLSYEIKEIELRVTSSTLIFCFKYSKLTLLELSE
jgi:hypothetical protein